MQGLGDPPTAADGVVYGSVVDLPSSCEPNGAHGHSAIVVDKTRADSAWRCELAWPLPGSRPSTDWLSRSKASASAMGQRWPSTVCLSTSTRARSLVCWDQTARGRPAP